VARGAAEHKPPPLILFRMFQYKKKKVAL